LRALIRIKLSAKMARIDLLRRLRADFRARLAANQQNTDYPSADYPSALHVAVEVPARPQEQPSQSAPRLRSRRHAVELDPHLLSTILDGVNIPLSRRDDLSLREDRDQHPVLPGEQSSRSAPLLRSRRNAIDDVLDRGPAVMLPLSLAAQVPLVREERQDGIPVSTEDPRRVQRLVAMLPRRQITARTASALQSEVCVICHEIYVVAEDVTCLPCHGYHLAHTVCIRGWFAHKLDCPSCRWSTDDTDSALMPARVQNAWLQLRRTM